MASPCPLLGDGVTDDTLLHIASFLPTAKDLLRLQLTNTRFSTKCIAAPSVGVGGGGPAAAARALGLDSSRDGFPPSKFLAPHEFSRQIPYIPAR